MKSFLELVEETKSPEHHHVMTFGRMNPPTTGHLKLIDKVKEIAKKHNATHTVVTSHSQDAKKNPLSAEQKVKHLKRYSPGTNFQASTKEHPTFLHHAAELHKKGVTHLHMVVGSDRVKEMKEKLNKYNGHHEGALYNFKKITVHSAGERDPDAEGTEGMSGTKMREHAKNKDVKSFKQGVPSHVSDTHAKELMHDTRKGMGLHESVYHGIFKAIFVTGGPGSGKDVVIREAIAEQRAVELDSVQAFEYLADKQKLSEKTSDYRREAIRSRSPLIINGPANDNERILYIKEELEELGYSTLMVFVDTNEQASKERNEKLTKMVSESVRHDKWLQSQRNKTTFSKKFEDFIYFDNSASFVDDEIMTETYQQVNAFIDGKSYNDVAFSWLENQGKLNINGSIKSLYKENKNDNKTSNQDSKSIHKTRGVTITAGRGPRADGPADFTPDNQATDPNADNIKWDANKKRGGYTFKTYTEAKGSAKEPSIKVYPKAKETNFSKDKEKIKNSKWLNSPSGAIKAPGIGPEYDTRTQGTVYPMSGMGDVTYREETNFKSFRNKIKEAIDDPGANDMGVGGVLNGASNKEPLVTPQDVKNGGLLIKKKKNR
jgi:cytidyltransferase-like protein